MIKVRERKQTEKQIKCIIVNVNFFLKILLVYKVD